MSLILAFDQSTSATKALLFDTEGKCIDKCSKPHQQYFPQPGWVEHDAEEIWQNLLSVSAELLNRQNGYKDLIAISITNQRETVVAFDRSTGEPICPAIVWQCQRSNELCENLAAEHEKTIHEHTGLRINPYFSASKIKWLLDNVDGLRSKVENGSAVIGTIETYLIFRLTKGEIFATDHTNASRTLLYDIHTLQWNQTLCDIWNIPYPALAEIRESASHFGQTTIGELLPNALPIIGVMGDSQASLFAQGCFESGEAKATFGTGSSVLVNTGSTAKLSDKGLVTALAWVINKKPVYALEGIIVNSAATINWLIQQTKLVNDVSELESMAAELDDTGGVYLVPAFAGLGFPHWQPKAKAAIVGLSAYSDKRHIARAALESIAFQLYEVVKTMHTECGIVPQVFEADGGPTANSLLMQFTADITGTKFNVAKNEHRSAQGAAFMGLLGLGVYPTLNAIKNLNREIKSYIPSSDSSRLQSLREGWETAIHQVLAGIK